MRRTDREVKDAEGILQIIESCKVCRIGMMDGEKIYIVPVNFGYIYEDEKLVLYFHGAREGKKLELIQKNPAVGIELDGAHELVTGKTACEYSYHYASLVGNGRAQIVTEPEEKLMALALIMKHQTGKEFEELEDTWNITHTVVNSKYQGQGIAKKLVKCVIQNSQQYDKKIIAECSYAKKVLQIKE